MDIGAKGAEGSKGAEGALGLRGLGALRRTMRTMGTRGTRGTRRSRWTRGTGGLSGVKWLGYIVKAFLHHGNRLYDVMGLLSKISGDGRMGDTLSNVMTDRAPAVLIN